jgi:ABC-2 type transport system ATP-binding protein
MIEISHLSKRYGALTAVDDVSFDVRAGEVLGFLGPNGAGKSTTMKMITGFLAPTSGTVRVCGHDVQSAPLPAKSCMGYLPEGAPSYGEMSVRAFLQFIADVRGLAGDRRRARLDDVIARLGLASVLEQVIETLSKGYRRRVGLAQALVHDPQVLILDEPTDGLDPNQKHGVRQLIAEMADEKAIVISTHILEEVEAICTRAVIIARGRVVADARPDELKRRSRHHNAVRITTNANLMPKLQPMLADLPGAAAVEPVGVVNGEASILVFPRDGRPIVHEVGELVRSTGLEVDEITVEQGRLDDVFRDLTSAAH